VCSVRPAQVTTDAGTVALLDAVPHVDVLINNLGIFGAIPALEISDDEWRRYFETDVLTAVRLTRAYLPGMRERGWGPIQYIAGDSAVAIPAEMIHDGVTRTAQRSASPADSRRSPPGRGSRSIR
jgi:NAD(P)-dependent dehydrogenase (short-subunit alcohol dehydrogenase family)